MQINKKRKGMQPGTDEARPVWIDSLQVVIILLSIGYFLIRTMIG